MDSRTSGYFYAIFAAFMLSTAFVTIKKLLEYVNTASLVFQYFSVASVLLFLIILARKDIKFFAKARGEAKTAVIIAALGIITAVMFQLSIQLLTPSFFAFIMRLSILTAFMLGVVFLKERFTRIEAVGTALAIAGTAILTYSPGKFLFLSVIFGVATAVIIGVQDFTWKKMVRKTHPITMNFYRTFAVTVALFLYLMLKGGFEAMPLQQMPLLVVAVVLSPVLGVASLIAAMSKLEISKVVTIRTLEPFIVVAYALVFFSTLPSLQELAGGSLIVAGVATMTLFHKLRNGRKVAASEG